MIAVIAVLAVVALLLVWLSLSMAATEGAVGRVTRASLNNLILEIQTDAELSQFIRDKKIKRIHKVQRLVTDRYATAGSCAFFRICCNVLDGVLVTVIAGMLDAPLWAEKSRSSRGARPLTVWSKPTISTLKFPKCCATCSRFPKH